MSAPSRPAVRRSRALLEAALPALEEAAASVPRNATGMHADAHRALHYLRKAIERADATLLQELPVAERRRVVRRWRGVQIEAPL